MVSTLPEFVDTFMGMPWTVREEGICLVKDIPLAAHDYIVGGKHAVENVMERQAATSDEAIGLGKDAGARAVETISDLRYQLSLLLRDLTVALENTEIVSAMPALVVEGQ